MKKLTKGPVYLDGEYLLTLTRDISPYVVSFIPCVESEYGEKHAPMFLGQLLDFQPERVTQ